MTYCIIDFGIQSLVRVRITLQLCPTCVPVLDHVFCLDVTRLRGDDVNDSFPNYDTVQVQLEKEENEMIAERLCG